MAKEGLTSRRLRVAQGSKKRANESLVASKMRADAIIRKLNQEYPEAKCSLTFQSPFQLLVATILSAQCTDERVNKVTPTLFAVFPDAATMARAPLGEIEEYIRTTGFFRAKAQSISTTAQLIVKDHGGQVPAVLEDLVKLRGVGRKTANVVLGVAFGIPGLVVDTHVIRIANLLGLAQGTDAVKIEQDLMKKVPRENWTHFGHLMIYHGRKICIARRPQCEVCSIESFCFKVGLQKDSKKSATVLKKSIN